MTQEESKAYALGGHKITHNKFFSIVYIMYQKDSEGILNYMFEDGTVVPKDWWNQDYLKDGWSLYE